MKLVSYDMEKREVIIKFTMEEFEREVSRASAIMNLSRSIETDKLIDGQLPIPFPSESSQNSEDKADEPISPEVIAEMERAEFEKIRQKAQRKAEEERKRVKAVNAQLYQEMRKKRALTSPLSVFKKNEVREDAYLLHSHFGQNLVDLDSKSDKSIMDNLKIKVDRVVYIANTLASVGMCDVYKEKKVLKQFKFKF